MIIKKKVKIKEVDDDKKTVHAHFVVKGFLLNFFNPAVPLFWLGVFSVVKLKEDYTHVHEGIFFASVLATAGNHIQLRLDQLTVECLQACV